MFVNDDTIDNEKPDGIHSLTFVVGELSGLFSHPSIFSIKSIQSLLNHGLLWSQITFFHKTYKAATISTLPTFF